ncbi:MAG: hypothetical protein L3J33_05600, partial [Rhodobacteraceae bacterium]|nr:hypothetical protein [Paracoccaceae bacterium]
MAKTKKTNPEPAKITDEVSDAEVIVQNDETPVEETSETIAAEPEIDPVADPEIDPETLHDEDHPVSIAARSLQILAFLAVGAGIGIWAAPKIAPLLPSGMAPIAQWLSPSNNAAIEDVEQLRLDLETRLSALESLPTRAEIETRLANFQTDTVNPVRSQMTQLSDQVAAADSTAVESRLWALEGRVEGLIAEIDSLTASLGNVAAEGGVISSETIATISAYRTRIDGLQASLNDMAASQGALSQRIDAVAATAERQVNEAEAIVAQANQETAQTISTTEIQTALTQIEAALKSGAAFETPLARIAANTDQPVPAALAAAQNGVQTLEDLQTAFIPAAHNAIRASVSDTGDTGLLSSFGSFLRSQVATRSLTPQQGNSADAILSRMEAALLQDQLETVLTEANTLPEIAKPEIADWIEQVRQRQSVLQGLAQLRNSL